ncbi:lariat debranching enzyme [Eublepharis macularius]|uniref:Lariat debranching enzyme n=1 Tax=Eublepharis macularius TaxID=481883 RepID=A0AA97KGV3_EUBMA|nr:lariat debranching enzyme [Eublepharis macularius]
MKVAVTGCCHGALDKMYETLELLERRHGQARPELLLCAGDFQAIRDSADMQCIAVPPKYRQMGGFAQYYSGEKKAPVLTIFIGGNHEASNHLQELPYGGWVAPNIYYLGYAGVVKYRGVRIGGISGIFKSHDYRRGHFECPPYNQNTLRSVYHVRNIEVFKLKQLKQPMDIFMSHDWPRGIYHYGDKNSLLKKKSFFRQEVENNTLGSPAASELLQHLKPAYWFSAHLHVKFAAVMQHEADSSEKQPKATKFLALDKCLPQRDFLQIVEIEHNPNASDCLEYDPEWIAVLKATNNLINISSNFWNMPENNGLHAKWDYSVTEKEIKEVLEEANNDLQIPQNFSSITSDGNKSQQRLALVHRINPQTTEFCARFGLVDINDRIQQLREEILAQRGEEEEEEADSTGEASDYNTDVSGLTTSVNPDEIILDDEASAEEDPDDSSDQHLETPSTYSELRRLPSCMNVSSDNTPDSVSIDVGQPGSENEEEEQNTSEKSLKRIGVENAEEKSGTKKIKRRNQAIYAAQEEEEVE